MTKRQRLRVVRREIEHTLIFCLCSANLGESKELTRSNIDKAVSRLPDKEEDLERILLEIRYALTFDGSLVEVLDDEELSERTLRQLLLAIEVEITARLTGEPKRILPFDMGGFRGSLLPDS